MDEFQAKLQQMTRGMPPERKIQWLADFLMKWATGAKRMNLNQFKSALGSLNINAMAAEEAFVQVDMDHNGSVDIGELCQAVAQSSDGASSPGMPFNRSGSMQRLGGGADSRRSPLAGSRSMGRLQDEAPSMQHTIRMDDTRRMGGAPPGAASRAALGRQVVPPGGRRSGASEDFGPRGSVDAPSQGPRFEVEERMSPDVGAGGYPGGRSRRKTSARASPGRGGPRNPKPKTPKVSYQPPVKVDLSEIVINEFRKLILKRGGAGGIHSLGRTFRVIDSSHDMRISLEELEIGLGRFGLHMSGNDLEVLMKAIDRDGEGHVSFDEFMIAVRGEINERRMVLINQAFDILDKNGNGLIEMDDIAAVFNVKHHPDVLKGEMSADQALHDFLDQFDGIDHDGHVDRKEFAEYYKNVSASIDSDDYFELMMRNAWHITGGKGWCENTSNKRVLVTFGNGTEKVCELTSDLGLDLSNQMAVRRQLERQGYRNIVQIQTRG